MKNKLDRFAARLGEWRAEGKTLNEVRSLLKESGCACSISQICVYCQWLEEQQRKDALLDMVARGARMVKVLDDAYEKNPPPGVEHIMRVTRTLIWEIQTSKMVNPKLLGRVTEMQRALLAYLSDKAKADLENKKLALSIDRFHFDAAKLCYAKLDELKAIKANSSLTDEQKVDAIRVALFGPAVLDAELTQPEEGEINAGSFTEGHQGNEEGKGEGV